MFTMDSAVEKDGTLLLIKKTLIHVRLSLLLKYNNMAWSFVGKLEQVSTYIWLKFKTKNNRKQNIVQVRPLTAKIKD